MLTAIVALGAMALATFLVERAVLRATRTDAARDLIQTTHAIEQLARDRGALRGGQARLVARSDKLRRLLSAETSGNPPGETLATIAQELSEPLTGVDLLAVMGEDGRLLSAAGPVAEDRELEGWSPVMAEPVQEALSGATSRRSAQGVWILGSRLLEVAAVAVAGPSGEPVGAILVGEELSATVARQLEKLSPSHVVILADDRIVGSSLATAEASRVADAFPELGAQPDPGEAPLATDPREVILSGTPHLALLTRTPVDLGGVFCNHILLRSLQPTLTLAHQIRRHLMAVAALAILLAFAIAWLGARRIARPLQHLAETMDDISRSRRLERPQRVSGGLELELFQDAFHRMLNALEHSGSERERSYVESVGAVMAAVDRRDQESSGHSYRVAYYATTLARRLDLTGDDLRAVEWGALLHDVGKIAVPDHILRKRGPLSEQEWEIMRQHPRWGYEMLAEVGFLAPALDIVHNHHEQWDGGGYPRGLEGEDIPLSARIFSVVDTYDAITSDRRYRGARSHDEAAEELRRVAGTQLDPSVVEIFLKIPPLELRRLRHLARKAVANLEIPNSIQEALDDLPTGTRG